MKAFNKAIVITGGIGTGKSSASAILSLYGFRIIDADKVAHKVLNSKYLDIAKVFGNEYIIEDNQVDRKALGKLVFSDSNSRKKLEEILHQSIFEEIKKLSIEQDKFGKPYLIDIPLFYERGNYPIDKVITVYAPKDLQIQRVIKRDNLTKDEAIKRVESQIDIEIKKKRAKWVIDNSGSLSQLQKECERVKEEILNS